LSTQPLERGAPRDSRTPPPASNEMVAAFGMSSTVVAHHDILGEGTVARAEDLVARLNFVTLAPTASTVPE